MYKINSIFCIDPEKIKIITANINNISNLLGYDSTQLCHDVLEDAFNGNIMNIKYFNFIKDKDVRNAFIILTNLMNINGLIKTNIRSTKKQTKLKLVA